MNLLKEKTLLYAEDEKDVQKYYAKYFEHYFDTVLIVSNGKEALEIYKDNNIDVIILDINMPLLNGLEVAKQIRETNTSIPIVLLSGRSDKQTLFEAIELNLVTYLEKPLNSKSIEDAFIKIAKYIDNGLYQNLWLVDDNYYVWHTKNQELIYKDKIVPLTRKEIILFSLFITNKGAKLTYEEIYQEVWMDENANYNETNIKTLIGKLRTKLPKGAIQNMYGMGYYLELD